MPFSINTHDLWLCTSNYQRYRDREDDLSPSIVRTNFCSFIQIVDTYAKANKWHNSEQRSIWGPHIGIREELFILNDLGNQIEISTGNIYHFCGLPLLVYVSDDDFYMCMYV